jgi:purine-binding chemotaxis protein CheW
MITATNQYVTFRLDSEIYAIDVGNAREIVGVPRLTRMPSTPAWIRGVMNLRGSVVPVVDMKHKFGMGRTEVTKDACILVVEFQVDEQPYVVGFLVDAVVEVFELAPSAIEEPPRFGTLHSPRYVKGMGRRGDIVFVVLDADKVLSASEINSARNGSEPEVLATVA